MRHLALRAAVAGAATVLLLLHGGAASAGTLSVASITEYDLYCDFTARRARAPMHDVGRGEPWR